MGEGHSKGAGGREPPVRTWLLLLLGVAGLAGLAVGGYAARPRRVVLPDATSAAAAGQQQRAQAVTEVALAPLPVGVPLVERAGVDTDGYPRSYVDKVALKSLLGRPKYRELSDYLEQF